jgi:hypothetical protein
MCSRSGGKHGALPIDGDCDEGAGGGAKRVGYFLMLMRAICTGWAGFSVGA